MRGDRVRKRLIDMGEVRRANARAGYYFFSNETMGFFKSRVESGVAVKKGEHAYFITSEKPPYGDREYKVRRYNPRSHHIMTEGERYESLQKARRGLCHIVGGKMRGSSCTIDGIYVA